LGATTNASWVAYRLDSALVLTHVQSGAIYRFGVDHGAVPPSFCMGLRHPWLLGRAATRGGGEQWVWFGTPDGDATRLKRRVMDGLPARYSMACFIEGDAALAALQAEPGPNGTVYHLDRVAVDSVGSFGAHSTMGTVQADAVKGMGGAPSRLSWLPSEQAVLLSGKHGLVRVGLDGSVATVGLPDLVCPDGGGALMPAWDTTVSLGRDGGIVFAARAENWPPERGSRIYSCKLDGSDLKRLTPLDDDPIPRYIIPATGEPAFKMPWEE
jgi:hypothetical protein